MKTLEKRYAKSERIVAKAKFSAWMFMRTVLLAVILGAVIAVVWVFKDQIEGLFTKSEEPAQYLTDAVMRWVLLGAAGVVLVSFIVQCFSFYGRELLLTEDKVIFREGILSVNTIIISLNEIKIVEVQQKFYQRIIGSANIVIVSDAEKPYRIKSVKRGDLFVKKIMAQVRQARQERAQATQLRLLG